MRSLDFYGHVVASNKHKAWVNKCSPRSLVSLMRDAKEAGHRVTVHNHEDVFIEYVKPVPTLKPELYADSMLKCKVDLPE
jgi:hypothetical protein